MRPFRFLPLIPAIAALALLLQATVAVAASEALVDEYLRKSGLWEQVTQIEPGMQAGLLQNHRQARQLTDDQFARLRAVCAVVYEPDRLRKGMRAQLMANLTEQDAQQALAWYATDLGTRIARMEEASSKPEAYERIRATSEKALAALAPARKAQIERLVGASGMAETAASVAIDQEVGVRRGLASFAGRPEVPPSDEAREHRERIRKQLAEALRPRLVADAAVVYGELNDKELAEYVAFLESPAGRKTSDVQNAALDKTLADAAQDLGRRMGDAVKPPDAKST